MTKKLKILFLTNIPSPYRVNFFNLLAEKVDLTVIYERATASDRQAEWKANSQRKYREIYLKSWHVGAENSFSLDFLKYLKKGAFDCIIVAGYSSPTWMLAITYCRMRHIPYWITSDGALFHTENGWKYHLKRFLIGNAEQCLCTSESTKKYLSQYIAPEKCHIFPFSSLYEKDILSQVPSAEEKLKLRSELKLSENKIVIGVGRYIHCKGFDVLLNTSKSISKDVGIYFIGDTPPADFLSYIKEHNLSNVHFIKFMPYHELCMYYRAADLFVLPTRSDVWGLVVHEALANGLPVITTKNCVAGLAMIKPGINGDLVESDDATALAASIEKFINNDGLLNSAAKNGLETSRAYTLENMTESHLKYFSKFIEKQ